MHRDFSEYALVDFINNYTQGLLERTLRQDNSQHRKTLRESHEEDNRSSVDAFGSRIRIPELKTETFLNTILDASKVSHDATLFFCSTVIWNLCNIN